MKNKDRVFNPTKIIIFIIMGGALVILSELFLFGGIKNISDRYSIGDEAIIDVASLRQQHNVYMSEGVYIDPAILEDSSRPSKARLSSVFLEENNDFDKNLVTIDDILEEQKSQEVAQELADIMPALGVDKEITDNNLTYNVENIEQRNLFNKIIVDHTVDGEEEFISEKLDNIDNLNDKNIIPQSSVIYEYDNPDVPVGSVAIIIDDMGVSLRSKLVEILPAPLTLSYLPYAKNLKERTKRAIENGHEVMLHMPMEPMNEYIDGGPKVLSGSQDKVEFEEILDWGLSQFEGFVGVNNHMGSRLTQDKDAMRRIMSYLKDRDANLFFIDSKTINSSVVADVAREFGVSYAVRDIFIDHEQTPEFIENALNELEKIALTKGYAIAIGHPHKETISALKKWIPTLKDKGISLVYASKLVKRARLVKPDITNLDSDKILVKNRN